MRWFYAQRRRAASPFHLAPTNRRQNVKPRPKTLVAPPWPLLRQRAAAKFTERTFAGAAEPGRATRWRWAKSSSPDRRGQERGKMKVNVFPAARWAATQASQALQGGTMGDRLLSSGILASAGEGLRGVRLSVHVRQREGGRRRGRRALRPEAARQAAGQRASSAWRIGSSASATSPTASARSAPSTTSPGKLRVIPTPSTSTGSKASGANRRRWPSLRCTPRRQVEAIDGQENPRR